MRMAFDILCRDGGQRTIPGSQGAGPERRRLKGRGMITTSPGPSPTPGSSLTGGCRTPSKTNNAHPDRRSRSGSAADRRKSQAKPVGAIHYQNRQNSTRPPQHARPRRSRFVNHQGPCRVASSNQVHYCSPMMHLPPPSNDPNMQTHTPQRRRLPPGGTQSVETNSHPNQ